MKAGEGQGQKMSEMGYSRALHFFDGPLFDQMLTLGQNVKCHSYQSWNYFMNNTAPVRCTVFCDTLYSLLTTNYKHVMEMTQASLFLRKALTSRETRQGTKNGYHSQA